MFSKHSRGTLNQSNIEILARTCPGKMARMVTLVVPHNFVTSMSVRCVSYFLLASLDAAEVWTSSTALLKVLMFSEEYRPEGLLYMLVTTLGLPELKGKALLLWAEPIGFTSYREKEQVLWEYKSQKHVKQNCNFKRLFHPIKTLIIYSPSCHSKPVWLLFLSI